MTFKYIKRKCGVRGCKNIGSFVISRTRELGNSVVICKECLETGLDAVKDFKPVEKPKKSGAPELFFSAPVEKAQEQVEDIRPGVFEEIKEAEITEEKSTETVETEEEPVKEEMPEQKKPAVKRGKRR